MTEDLGPAKTFFAYMDAVLASDLSKNEKFTLIVQAKHADAWDGELTNSFPSEDTLARETGLSKDTIQRVRKALVEKGWLIQTHSGRGGNSNLSNAYDLVVPESKPQGAVLQSRKVPGQSRRVRKSKPQGAATSTPSSTTQSPPSSTPAQHGQLNNLSGRTEDGHGDGSVSYWVGISKRKPDGYFKRIDDSTVEPKGDHVRVTLTREDNRDIFACYEYPEIRDILVDRARELGLRPKAQTSPGAPVGQSGNRYPELGPSPFTVIRREPESRSRSQQEIARDILEGRW